MGKLHHCLRGWLWSLGFGPWKMKSRCGGLQRWAQDRQPNNSFLNYCQILLPYFSHPFFSSPLPNGHALPVPFPSLHLVTTVFYWVLSCLLSGPSPSLKPMTGERYPSSSQFQPVPAGSILCHSVHVGIRGQLSWGVSLLLPRGFRESSSG